MRLGHRDPQPVQRAQQQQAVARPSPVVWWSEVDDVAGLLAAQRDAVSSIRSST